MSRSGYSGDCENVGLWRAAVDRAIRGKRGQAFLRELLSALDALPSKRLIDDDLVREDGEVCAIGAVAVARKLDTSKLDAEDGDEVGKAFGIARALACELAYENDERQPGWLTIETPEERWTRMRAWVAEQIIPDEPNRP
jgi:hypothetical protein